MAWPAGEAKASLDFGGQSFQSQEALGHCDLEATSQRPRNPRGERKWGEVLGPVRLAREQGNDVRAPVGTTGSHRGSAEFSAKLSKLSPLPKGPVAPLPASLKPCPHSSVGDQRP